MLEMYSPILFLFVLIILSRVVAAIMAQSAAGRKPPSTEEETQFRRPMMSEEIQRRIEKAEDPFRGQMQHNPAPESAEEGSLMEMIRRASEDRAVYSGGDKSMSFGDRLEKEIQMRQHRRKVAGYRRAEQEQMRVDEQAREQRARRQRLEDRKEELEEFRKKKEAAEREKSIGKARANATDSPEVAAAHAAASSAGGYEGVSFDAFSAPGMTPSRGSVPDFEEDSHLMDGVWDAMVCGPDTSLPSTRDFIGEATAMLNRSLSGPDV